VRYNKMEQHWIEIAAGHGHRFTGHVARPAQPGAPGLVLLHDRFGIDEHVRALARRYAEEGYLVVVPDLYSRLAAADAPEARGAGGPPGIAPEQAAACERRLDTALAIDDINATLEAVRNLPEHAGKVGVLGYGLGGKLAFLTAARTDVDCAVAYSGPGFETHLSEARAVRCPLALHVACRHDTDATRVRPQIAAAFAYQQGVVVYTYGTGERFNVPGPAYDHNAASLAYSRSLALLKKTMGPVFAIERVWKRHAYHKYVTRDFDALMDTMVADPYFNDVPTMTGGVGRESLTRFYHEHFVNSMPADAQMVPVSRTVGIDRLVDEFVLCCTHDVDMHWMLPGVAPTGRYFEVAMVAVVRFRGEKIDNLHVYWDQASVLVQIGLLDPARLPVTGVESARRVLDVARSGSSLMPGLSGDSLDRPAA
jgi:carboxymethylenebutenolidase